MNFLLSSGAIISTQGLEKRQAVVEELKTIFADRPHWLERGCAWGAAYFDHASEIGSGTGLFVGNLAAAQSEDFLKKHNITHVINCATEAEPLPSSHQLVYHHFRLIDVPSEQIDRHFDDAFLIMDSVIDGKDADVKMTSATSPIPMSVDGDENVLEKPRRPSILVHCMAGISRSATIAASYLIKKFRLTSEQALTLLQHHRSVICPNMGFRRRLDEYHKRLFLVPLLADPAVANFADLSAAEIEQGAVESIV